MHAHHAEVERIVAVDDARAHEGVGAGHAGLLHEGGQFRARPGGNDAAAVVDGGTLGVVDDFRRLVDGIHVNLRGVGIANGSRGHEFGQGRGHVLGNIHQHRALAAGLGDAEGLAQNVGQILHPVHNEVVLGDGHGDAGNVHFLEAVLSDEGRGHVAGNGDHGHAVHVGGGNAGNKVGRTGAAGYQNNAGAAGSTGVAIGRMSGALFMGGNDMTDTILVFIQCVVQIQHSAAGVAEQRINALLHQHFTKNFRTGQFHILHPYGLKPC